MPSSYVKTYKQSTLLIETPNSERYLFSVSITASSAFYHG